MAFELERAIQLKDLWFRLGYGVAAGILKPVQDHKRSAVPVFLLVIAYFTFTALRSGYDFVSTASLLLSPPSYQTEVVGSEFISPPLDVPSYAALLRDSDVLQKVCDRLMADNPTLWQKAHDRGNLVPEVLAKMLTTSTEVVAKTPQSVLYSRRIAVSARAKSPEQAKSLLDAWVAVGIEAVRRFSVPGSDVTVEFVRNEYDKARGELTKREEALRVQRSQWNLAMMNRTKAEKELKLATLETDLLTTEADAAEAESQLVATRDALTSEPEKKTLVRSPSNDAIAIIESTGKSAAKSGPTFIDEIQNPVWVELKQHESTQNEKVSGLTAKGDTLKTQIESLTTEIEKLNNDVVTQQLKDTQLQRDVTTSKEYFDTLATQREKVATLEASAKLEGASSIMLANAPVLPTKPDNFIARWAPIPLGFVLGLIAAIAIANILHELRQAQANYDNAKPSDKTSEG